MKYRTCIYHAILIFLFSLYCLKVKAQTTNPCGVKASISPAARDSVVPLNTIIPFTSTSINATSLEWLYDGLVIGLTGPLWNYVVGTGVHTISLVARNGNCSDTTTVVYFSAGTPHDVDSFMVANYGLVDTHEYGTCVDNTLDGAFVLGGYGVLYNCGEKGLIVKLRDKGCIDWSKDIKGQFQCDAVRVTSVYASADANYYVAANNGPGFLMKFDNNGNLLWNKRWEIQTLPFGYIGHDKLTGDPNGNIYTVSQSLDWGWTVTKLDRSGNVSWNKYYQLGYFNPADPGGFDYANPGGITWLNGNLYIAGNAFDKTTSRYFNFLTKIDAATGQTSWKYGYMNGNGSSSDMIFDHLTTYDSLLMVSGGGAGQYVTLIDQQGNVKKHINAKFPSSYSSHVTRAEAGSNGQIYLMQWTEQTLPLQPYFSYYTNFAKIDTSLNKYWGMVYSTYPRGYFADAAISKNNSFGAVGMDFGYVTDGLLTSRDFRFIKVDTPVVSSDLNCNYNTLDYNLTAQSLNRFNFQWRTDSSFVLNDVPVANISVSDAYVQSRYSCPDFIDSCSFMKITGPASMCGYADTYTYRVHRNRKCSLVPQWILSPGISIVTQTDTTLTVKFDGFGSYSISSVLKSCIPVKDSIIINIVPKTSNLNIGNDTTICTNTFIALHAGPGFTGYLWADGSTDSVFTASQPGIYWVQVTDSCGNSLRDSITVTSFNLAISIGPDRTKCTNDTLHLDAPGGFLNYEWSNNYNISSTSLQHVVVNPSTDTAYYLKAEKLPGCFAFDTVRINVKTSPPIMLGPDKSFCAGDSMVLNAGSGFTQYQWSNGNATQRITVYTAGNYSLIGTTSDGCKSYDTLRIENVWANPVVNLDDDPDLCSGSTRTLLAGNYASYRWQDGSTSSSFMISGPGTYYVTVTDNHSCKGSDTTRVLRLLPSPANFLPADTAICNYGEVILFSSQTYSSYLWNTGQTSPSITVNQPGSYWMQATDQYNCKGTDTVIILPKECMKGLYVPTAFTPNLDGKNDVLKPLIFGSVAQFEWTVYNRFGQIIFTSNSPSKGWDGTVKGILQNPGSYVWVCRYRFAGEAEQVKTGSVILLR